MVRVLGTVVVFCTTYALILPAITMEQEAICGIEAHEHTEECYTQQPVMTLACSIDADARVIHTHDALCYDAQGALVCLLPELQEHTHSDTCYAASQIPNCSYVHVHDDSCETVKPVLVCGREETEGHAHSDSCTFQRVLICETAEQEAHTHGEDCVSTEQVLICTEAEKTVHIHAESCYEQKQIPCQIAEQVGHTHGEGCVSTEQILTCTETEETGHIHGESCYEQKQIPCQIAEQEGHTHGEGCVSTEQILTCTETEEIVHIHGESCYEQKQIPCEIPESAGHVHNENCYETQAVVCTLEEAEAHTHTEACYEEQTVPCELTTNDGHVHESLCYPQELSCDMEEINLHTHEAACYDEAENLICTQPQVIAHVHGEACMVETEQLQEVLICELEEHIHEESCYPEEEEAAVAFICGMGVHAHVEACYGADGQQICTIPEHTHDASCVLEDLDLTADVETEADWQEMFRGMSRTGNWPRDILAVAKSQLNYHESEKNVILVGEELKGYTRYGAWYGDPYGDWDTMFVSFCLNYAGIQDIPQRANADAWMDVMKELQLYAAADSYMPKAGDLIFFDYDQVEEPLEEIPVVADQVGIVAEVTPASEAVSGTVSFIIGNYGDQVSYVTCDLEDVTIAGYTDMPAGDIFYLTYAGADFTVTVTVGKEAGIPDSAQLAVQEIAEGTDEYNTYYQQSVEALMNGAAEGEELPEVSFARFFDIRFLVNGETVEPVAPVDIQIRYQDMIEKKEDEDGLVVHFAKEGVEVLNADTYSAEPAQEEAGNVLDEIAELFTGTSEKVDTFRFTQDSFSVSGTLFAVTPRAANVATKVDFDDLDGTGNTSYIVYTRYNGRYYAIAAPASGKTGQMVEVTVADDGTVSWNSTASLRWTFVSTGNGTYDVTNENGRYLHAFYNGNGSDTGVIGTNSKGAALISEGTGANETFNVKHPTGDVYVGISRNVFQAVTSQYYAQDFYIAAVQPSVYHVWFDGTNGGMMSYYGSDDTYQGVDPANNTITLPETWKSPTKYPYALAGWYNIKTNTYHQPGEQVTIDQHSVFYADWVAATYDVGQQNGNTVASVDTSNFITTYVFDYNVLFNLLSQSHTGTVSASSHSETWTILNNGESVPYNGDKSLGFSFIDYDRGGDFSYANNRTEINYSRDQTTPGIITHVNQVSGKNLLDLLFNPGTSVIGKKYVGTGNYLFQYMDSTTSNYDGEHDGYYYLDARLNAASYNQSAQRFYLYNYLERTSDSQKDGGGGIYSDFLPFNSPYLFDEDQLDYYTDSIVRSGWTYDAKAGNDNYNSTDDAATNYFFGTRTDIEFFLPNNAGWHDEYGNYGNISTRGQHMVFEFHGDDDVWVYVDGKLMLDIGGMHGIQHGSIDFSTGTISYGLDGANGTQKFDLGEGTHTMTIYYMERGSSQSNCAIYFNIAPRYDLEIMKEDVVTATKLNGAVFSIFNDEAMTSPAQLWESEEAYNADMADDGVPNSATNQFTVKNGVASCWGISAGKTYYIYETTPPSGYPESDDMIRITLNNRGTATIETTTLHGDNGIATEGFAVIKQNINETLKIVALTVTNQKEGRHTEVRVEKDWASGSSLPQSISVFLTRDGERYGRTAVLNESNGWSYTWTGLDKYRSEGVDDPYVYEVQEVLVPGFITIQGESREVVDYVDWIRVDTMSDSKTFLLVHNNQAMTCDENGFGWMSITEAEKDESLSAQWNVTTNHDGFRLTNGNGYNLTYSSSGFYGSQSNDIALNQVFYYLNNRLVAHNNDVYYQFGPNGSVVSSDGLAFTLYQKEVMTGLLTNIINEPVVDEEQTYVEVTKVWKDGNDKHASENVIIHLFSDGRDTGRTVTLNAANNWKGGFYELPYALSDGTVIAYTVEESNVENYLSEYSDPVALPAVSSFMWKEASALVEGETYRFISGSYAMAEGSENKLISVVADPDAATQNWEAVSYNGGIILRNASTGNYLDLSNDSLSTVSSQRDATAVTMQGNLVSLGNMYLEISASHVGLTSNPANISNQKVTKYTEIFGKPGTGYTVTNTPSSYMLPQTGGMGTFTFTFGGLLMMAVALMYVVNLGRKHQRGGKYARKR